MTCHDVVIVGAAAATQLRSTGITGVVVDGVISSVFDEDTDAWMLTTHDGRTVRARVVVSGKSPFVPWMPELPGHKGFQGFAFHAAAPDPAFDPVGRRVAVIGCDCAAGWFIERLRTSAASVTAFPHPPRRVVPARRKLRRWHRRTSPQVVPSPIDTITASGIRTQDGVHYDVDAIVYGTGLALADRDQKLVGVAGLPIQQAWHDGMEPYLGIAVHGFPNYFIIAGPHTETSVRDVASCLQLMTRAGSSRIMVRRSTQHVFNERVRLHQPRHRPKASAFELSSSSTAHDDVYDGAATLTSGETRRQVRTRLIGHFDPIDGQYHWQGMIFDQVPTELFTRSRAVTLAIGERSVPAHITEQTPQGTYSIAGLGAPPFPLDAVELTAPQS